MKNFTKLFSLAMLIMFVFGMQNAKADSQRMYLMECFTNSGCSPCAQSWPIVDPIFEENYDVCIPIKYHTAGPDPSDSMYINNQVMSNNRSTYYNIEGVPHLMMNGTTGAHPLSINELVPSWNELRGVMSPVTLTISEVKNGANVDVTVNVSSSQAISGKTLRIVLMEYQVLFTGSNGEPVHKWVTRDMLPNVNGTAINIGADASKDVKVTYAPKSTYKASNLYIVAFLQDDATKEVIQAGSNLLPKLVRADVSVDNNKYLKIGRNATLQKVFTVKNPNTFATEFTLSIGSSSIKPTGVNITLDKSSVTLQPNESADVTATIASPSNAFFSRFFVVATPKASGKVIDSDSAYAYVLTNDAKYACYSNYGAGSAFVHQALLSSETYKNDAVLITTYEQGLFTEYPPTSFDLGVFASNFSNAENMANASGLSLNILTTIDAMIKAGKRVFFMNEAGAYYAFNSQTTSNTLKFMLQDNLGIVGASSAARVTVNSSGQITGILKFNINGIKSDAIGQSINSIVCNDASTDHPYFIILSDSLILQADGIGKPFMYTDKPTAYCGVRAEIGESARMAYSTIGLEAIKNATSRNAAALAIIDWLMSDVSAEPKIKITPDQLDFQRVKANTSKELTLKIENRGLKPLQISSMTISGDDNVYTFTNGDPTDIPALNTGEIYEVSVSFLPKEEGKEYWGEIQIVSNSILNGDATVGLIGLGIGDETYPEIYVPKTSYDFNKVDVGKVAYDTFNISNKGTAPLNLTNIYLSHGDDFVFNIEEGDVGLPTLAPGISHRIIVSYSPEVVDKVSTATLNISSDDPSTPEIAIAYKGTCQDTINSVNYTNDKNVSLEVLPNPIVSNGTVKLNIANGYKNIVLSVVDASGRKVAELYNGFYSEGKYEFAINANEYSTGAYTIIANVDGEALTVPFIIKK